MTICSKLYLAAILLAVTNLAALAADPNLPDDRKAPTTAPDVAKTLLPSLVRVELTTHYDRGEVPHGGAAWPGTHNDVGYETLIKEERPAEAPGWVIAPDRVLCPDMMIHPRFLSAIKVRQGSQTVDAKVISYAKQQEAMLLQLDKSIDGAKPIEFVDGG